MSAHDRIRRAVDLVTPTRAHEGVFLEQVAASRKLHRGLASPPSSAAEYRAYVRKQKDPRHVGRLVLDRKTRELAGVINLNEIVRGSFESAFLGYYAFLGMSGQGYMEAGLRAMLRLAFKEVGLHRLEANIQPHNTRSIALVERIGFRFEGFAPRYLKIGGRWRDHERYAITREDLRRR